MPANPYSSVTFCGNPKPKSLILSLREHVEMTNANLGHHDVAKYSKSERLAPGLPSKIIFPHTNERSRLCTIRRLADG